MAAVEILRKVLGYALIRPAREVRWAASGLGSGGGDKTEGLS